MLRRYAIVRQLDGSDCGAAALATVALHYRRPASLQHLRDLAGTDRLGANLLGLTQAAERLGFAARGVKSHQRGLSRAPLPAIAHVRTGQGEGHFVVIHRVAKKVIVVADPARGVRKQDRTEFGRQWSGYLLLLVPEPLAPSGTSGHGPVGPWRRLVGLLSGHGAVLAEACACALLMTALGALTSYFLQHLVDSVLVRHEAQLLNALGLGMALIVLFRTLFGALRHYLLAHVSRKVDLALVAGYSRHLLDLPLGFFEMRRVGEIMSRVNDAFKVREAVSSTTTTAVVDAVLVVLMLSVLWLYDPPLAAAATAFIPLLLAGAALHHPAVQRRSRQGMEDAASLFAHLVEDVSGVETVKAFGVERARMEEGEGRLVRYVQTTFALQKIGLSMDCAGMLITASAGLAVLWYGGHRVIAGALTVGQLMFFYSLLVYLLEPLQRLASVSMKLQDGLVAVDRLCQILDLETEAAGPHRQMPFDGVRDALELRDVSFQYGYRGNVLEHVSARIPAGRTVAFVGESGSGKSTLLKLLQGFYTPTGGRVLIDGVDLREFELASLRRGIGVVAQDPFIFGGTLRDNIVLGRPGVTPGEVIAAARAAELDEFVAELPDRYETALGERGANLSGGQRQRLAIARALLRRPAVLVFDEATSQLDSATERAVRENLKRVLAGRTVILVAHRLSMVKDADYIYVLHRGRVHEEGTHRQLMEGRGMYATLWRHQTADDEGEHRPPGEDAPCRRTGYADESHANGVGHV